MDRHTVERKSTTDPARRGGGVCLAAVLLMAIGLPAQGVDSGAATTGVENDTQTIPEIVRQINAGAHGGADPHRSLTPEQHIQVALQHRAAGRLALALSTLDQAIVVHDRHAALLAVRGSLLMEEGDVAAALRDLEGAVALDPNDASTLTNRAQAYRRFGRISEALTDLDRAIELEPSLLAARFNRGAIRYSSGEFREALADFDTCVAIDPHQAGPYFNRASAKAALHDHEGAIDDLNRFMRISNNDAWNASAKDLIDQWRSLSK